MHGADGRLGKLEGGVERWCEHSKGEVAKLKKKKCFFFYASCLHGVTSPPLAHETMSADRHTKTVGELKRHHVN